MGADGHAHRHAVQSVRRQVPAGHLRHAALRLAVGQRARAHQVDGLALAVGVHRVAGDVRARVVRDEAAVHRAHHRA